MKAIKQIQKIKNKKITIKLPPDFNCEKAEIIILPYNTIEKYHFTDLAGRLEWKGNAIKEQRILRDEWE
ncbi:MAG: hypothetical protein U5R06_16105 [candidate division KSB1 bacterium]|nr:hypothetical protein [candidate division KSB1 bacterium]